MRNPAGRLRAAIVSLVLTSYIANCLAPTLVSAQETAASKVMKGQEYYEQSLFDEAIKLLKDLVGPQGGLTGDDLRRARELLARSYVKKGDPIHGKETFKEILRGTPAWRPDEVLVPPDEMAVFHQALAEYTQEAPTTKATPAPSPPVRPAEKTVVKSSKKVWYLVGGGVLVAGIVAMAASSGKKDGAGPPATTTLAAFPNPPSP